MTDLNRIKEVGSILMLKAPRFLDNLSDDTWLCYEPISKEEPEAVWYLMQNRGEVFGNFYDNYQVTFQEVADYWNHIRFSPLSVNKLMDLVKEIRNHYLESDKNIVIGLDGSLSSAVTAAICAKAVGSHKVIGIILTTGNQLKTNRAFEVVQELKIPYYISNVKAAVTSIECSLKTNDFSISHSAYRDALERIKMATLYAYADSVNGEIINPINATEILIDRKNPKYFEDCYSPMKSLSERSLIAFAESLGLQKLVDYRLSTNELSEFYEAVSQYIDNGMKFDKVPEKFIGKIKELIK